MAFVKIVAHFDCDGCGRRFSINCDEGSNRQLSMADHVEANLGAFENDPPKGLLCPFTSRGKGQKRHLCAVCTEKADAELDAEDQASIIAATGSASFPDGA